MGIATQRNAGRVARTARAILMVVAIIALAACAANKQQSVSHAAANSATEARPEGVKLQRVVMLMRHGVRPPTRAKVTPDGVADKPWPKWSTPFGDLTHHGYLAAELLGQWDRSNWSARGLLPKTGCPQAGSVVVVASAKKRTQDTARAWVEGAMPDCGLQISYPANLKVDYEFHPLDTGTADIDAAQSVREAEKRMPPGGMKVDVQNHQALFDLLNRTLGCCSIEYCKANGLPAPCSLSQVTPGLKPDDDGGVDIGPPFGLASTVSETFLMEYAEGLPMSDVAWGRLTPEQVGELVAFHAFKYYYEARTPYVAARSASPLARRMLAAMQNGPALTVLVGHDTNVANLAGLLDLHFQVPGNAYDDPTPAGALGFEVLQDASGAQFVRAFYRSQTLQQMRDLQVLDAEHQPAYMYLMIPGCTGKCTLEDFANLVGSKLVLPKAAPAAAAKLNAG
jgi:4-phytase/acid phosphatase